MSTASSDHTSPPESQPDTTELRSLHQLAATIARDAGEFLKRGLQQDRVAIDTKSTGTDMVSEMDRGAEKLIVDAILSARPHDGILGEEGADRKGSTGFRWVIDPLDGTTNYLYKQPLWAVSIGVEHNDFPVIGVVVAPMLHTEWSARLGAGATANDAPIHVSTCNELGLALIGTGFGYLAERRAQQGRVVADLLPLVRDIRRGGSAAIDLSFVASGLLDASYERGLQPWDSCAGTCIIREAGGVVTGLHDDLPSSAYVVAGNPSIHSLLRTQLLTSEQGSVDANAR